MEMYGLDKYTLVHISSVAHIWHACMTRTALYVKIRTISSIRSRHFQRHNSSLIACTAIYIYMNMQNYLAVRG